MEVFRGMSISLIPILWDILGMNSSHTLFPKIIPRQVLLRTTKSHEIAFNPGCWCKYLSISQSQSSSKKNEIRNLSQVFPYYSCLVVDLPLWKILRFIAVYEKARRQRAASAPIRAANTAGHCRQGETAPKSLWDASWRPIDPKTWESTIATLELGQRK